MPPPPSVAGMCSPLPKTFDFKHMKFSFVLYLLGLRSIFLTSLFSLHKEAPPGITILERKILQLGHADSVM